MSEEKRIMDILGIGQIEGNVRGEHTGKLLSLLRVNSGKRWDYIIKVSPVIMGMQRRYIKENYLEGFLELGIIKLYSENNILYYKWFGDKELNGSLIHSEPKQVLTSLDDLEKEERKKELIREESKKEEQKKEEPKEGLCPSCGKILKGERRFCNEKCLRIHYEKRKEKKQQ